MELASAMPTNLPLELWRIIMRHAVHIRGALETVMTTQFEWNEWRYNEDVIYEVSMQTRRALVQVCKAWYWPASEILYEDIRLRLPEDMEILRECLDESSPPSDNHLPRGWWTKRLDLPDLEDYDDPLLEPLISHFPNLRIVQFWSIDSIRNIGVSIPKLRYTDLEPDEDSFIPPDLDTLILSPITRRIFTFHALTSLEVILDSLDTSILQDYSFPNLQHFILRHAIEAHIPVLEAFLHRYSQQLLSLRDSARLFSASHIEQFLCKAPNIRELIVLPYGSVPNEGNTFPSVTHIGIADGFFDALGNPFFSITRFPRLNCIRMVDNRFQDLERPTFFEFRDWYLNRRLAGVRYEDVNGDELSTVVDDLALVERSPGKYCH